MYCTQCGKLIDDGIKFCTNCGAPVQMTSTVEPKRNESDGVAPIEKKTHKKTPIIIGIVLVCLIVISVAGYFGIQAAKYEDLISTAASALEQREYETAISAYQQAIAQKPKVAENYLKLATAYVETYDLYSAKNILSEGYSATQDKSLNDVYIWGPINPFEWYLADETVIGVQYHFMDNTVQSIIDYYDYGNILLFQYGFNEDGKISWIEAYAQPFLGIINIDYASCFSACGGVAECSYNKGGQLESICHTQWRYGQEEQSIMPVHYASYDENYEITMGDYCFKFADFRLQEISSIDDPDESVLFEYNEEGSSASYGGEIIYQFDTYGKNVDYPIQFEYDQAGRIITSKAYDDRDDSIDYVLLFERDENGNIQRITYSDTLEGACSNIYAECAYNELGQLVKIIYPEEQAERTIEYDESGRYLRMNQTSLNSSYQWEITYTYLENGDLDEITTTSYSQTTHEKFLYVNEHCVGSERSRMENIPGWCDGAMGAQFYIPEGFEMQEINDETPLPGHTYRFCNYDLAMTIQVNEGYFAASPLSNEESMEEEYNAYLNMHSMSEPPYKDVTYTARGENWYVASGYLSTAIFYTKVINKNGLRYEIYFTYPAENADTCNPMVGDFCDSFYVL